MKTGSGFRQRRTNSYYGIARTALLCIVLAAGAQDARAETMLGVTFGVNGGGNAYLIDSITAQSTLLGSTANRLNSLARSSDGQFYSMSDNTLVRVSPVTGAATIVADVSFSPYVASVRGLAFSPQGVLYAVNNIGGFGPPGSPNYLYTIDLQTGQATFIGDTGETGIQALTFSPAGQLFGYTTNSAGLITINPMTAVATDVNPAYNHANSPLIPTIQSLTFGPNDTLYASDGRLFTFDPQTGMETLIGPIATTGDSVRGLEILPEPAAVGLLAFSGLTLFRRRQSN